VPLTAAEFTVARGWFDNEKRWLSFQRLSMRRCNARACDLTLRQPPKYHAGYGPGSVDAIT